MKWKRWTVVAAALGLALGLLGWVTSRPAVIRSGGRAHEIAIPAPHLCFEQSCGQALCYVVGDRDLNRFFTAAAAADRWRYDEQMGSGYLLSKEDLLLSVGRRQRGASFVVELTLQLSSIPPRAAP